LRELEGRQIPFAYLPQSLQTSEKKRFAKQPTCLDIVTAMQASDKVMRIIGCARSDLAVHAHLDVIDTPYTGVMTYPYQMQKWPSSLTGKMRHRELGGLKREARESSSGSLKALFPSLTFFLISGCPEFVSVVVSATTSP
jgi:hypothetical protein